MAAKKGAKKPKMPMPMKGGMPKGMPMKGMPKGMKGY